MSAAPAVWKRMFGEAVSQLPVMSWVLAATQLINRMGGAVRMFMPLYLHQALHLPMDQVGWLLACNGVGMLAGSWLGGVMTDHWPARRLAVGMLFSAALIFLLYLFLDSIWWLAPLLLVTGFTDVALRPQIHRLIMEACPPETRATAQSLNRVSINLAVALAGVLGGIAASMDYRIVFLFDSLTSALAGVWLWWALRRFAPEAAPAAQTGTAKAPQEGQTPYQDPPFLWFVGGALVLQMVFETINIQLGNYMGAHYRLGPSAFGWQMAINGLLITVVQIPLTAWGNRRHPPTALVLSGGALMALGAALVPLGQSFGWVSFTTVVWTVAEMLWMPTLVLLVMQRAEGRRTGHYLGVYSMAWSIAGLLAPVWSSQLIHHGGADSVWYLSGLACVLVLPLLLRTGRVMQDQHAAAKPAEAGGRA